MERFFNQKGRAEAGCQMVKIAEAQAKRLSNGYPVRL